MEKEERKERSKRGVGEDRVSEMQHDFLNVFRENKLGG